MSLDQQIIIPANKKKYTTEDECIFRWENGIVFQISESGLFCSIRDCQIGDRLILAYQFPNMSKLLYYEFTEDIVLRLSRKWLNEQARGFGHVGTTGTKRIL